MCIYIDSPDIPYVCAVTRARAQRTSSFLVVLRWRTDTTDRARRRSDERREAEYKKEKGVQEPQLFGLCLRRSLVSAVSFFTFILLAKKARRLTGACENHFVASDIVVFSPGEASTRWCGFWWPQLSLV